MSTGRHVRGFLVMACVWGALLCMPVAAQTTVGPYTFQSTSSSGVIQGQAEISGAPAAAGDIAVAYDPQGVVAGAAEVIMNGGVAYINLVVYGDDATTAGVDEGMEPGDSFTLALWDASAGAELGGTSVSGWQNTNGSPMPGLDNPSQVYSFQGLVTAPGAVTLTSPADGATGTAANVTLSWSAVGSATGYDVQVSDNAGFTGSVFSSTGQAGTTAGVTGLNLSTAYFWRVRATNQAGSGPWSSRSFTTRDPAVPSAPVLSAPADGATDVSRNVTFSWQASTDATSYEIQVATDIGFGSVVESAANLGTTSHAASVDAYATTYFWRVRASGVAGTGAWSAGRSFTTEDAPPPPAPDAPLLGAPDNGATGVALAPTLTWGAVSGAVSGAAVYDVEVASDDAFSSIVANAAGLTATTYQATGLDILTTYWWRVRARNAGGTGDWSAPRSFETVPPNAPDVIGLESPADGAMGTVRTPVLSWASDPLASSYDLEVSTSAGFLADVEAFEPGAGTSFMVTGRDWSTTYFWRVRGRNAGGAGPWSAVRSFTTIVEAPGVPDVAEPVDGATGQAWTVTLSWVAAARAVTHDFQLATDQDFQTLVAQQAGLTSPEHTVTDLQAATTYFWRVRGVNEGGTGAWMPAVSFTTIVAAPGATTLQLPGDAATDVSLPVVVQWDPAPGAASYDVEVATDAGFQQVVLATSTTGNESQAGVTGLDNDVTYFWRVRAVNTGGDGPWSNARSFTTIVGLPGIATADSPADDATGVPVDAALTWGAAARAATYRIQVATGPAFAAASLVFDSDDVAGTSFSVSGLDWLTPYYWRVQARNVAGNGPWSTVQTFTTGPPPPPETPAFVAPAHLAEGTPVVVVLDWTAPASAVSFDVQVAASTAFTDVVFSRMGVTSNGVETDSLAFSTTYFWRVRAHNAGGASAWSAARSFTTMALPAPPPADLASPGDKESGVAGRIVLDWNPVSIAETYDVQLSGFGVLLVDTTGVTTTSLEVDGLDGNTEYFWRVRARNSVGVGSWSPSFSFRTSISVAAESADELPTDLRLHAPYPNPFRTEVTIPLDVDVAGPVRVAVYDMTGRLRAVPHDGALAAGQHTFRLHALDGQLSSGLYVVRASTADGRTTTISLTLVR